MSKKTLPANENIPASGVLKKRKYSLTNTEYSEIFLQAHEAFLQTKENFAIVVSTVFSLQNTLTAMASNLHILNWLDDWHPFSFDKLTDQEVLDKQQKIESFAEQKLNDFNLANGKNYSIVTMYWRKIITNPTDSANLYVPLVMALEIYLDPPASRSASNPGGGGGTISPTLPKQPPPPPIA